MPMLARLPIFILAPAPWPKTHPSFRVLYKIQQGADILGRIGLQQLLNFVAYISPLAEQRGKRPSEGSNPLLAKAGPPQADDV